MAAARMGQAGGGDGLHCGHIESCGPGTRTPLRSVCERRRPSKDHGQDHPDDSY